MVDGRRHGCDVLRVRIAPGLGFSESDRLALFIDREEGLMRRVRFTLNGLDSTRGAVAEVDASGHVALRVVRWPTRFHELPPVDTDNEARPSENDSRPEPTCRDVQ